MLHGRHAELATIDDVLDMALRQRAGALVVRGEAGIGKSALLAHAAERAGDLRMLRAVGVESEAEFAFAALHQLLWPLHKDIEGLPAPQAAALRGAFGLTPVPVEGPDRFLVAVAVLTLLAEAAERQPLLCLVDDAHWIDRPSADALLFVARRLGAEGIAMLFAARDGDGQTFAAAPGIPELHVGGLDGAAAAALLVERNPDGLGPRVVEDLVARTGGNPLALREVSQLLEPPQLAGRAPLPEALPLGVGLEGAFLTRMRRLSPAAQAVLEVMAAEGSAELATVVRATEVLGADADALGEAEQAGLATVVDDRIEFGHPLLRSAVYRSMTFARRRAVHRALVDSLDADAPDRRAWHLAAAAASGPDESVAVALEESAERARRRSGHASAATALHRAAELSGGAEDRARRFILAADSAWLGGQAQRSQTLVDLAAPLATGAREQAAIAYLRGLFQLRGGVPARAADILIDGAELAAGHDAVRALEMLLLAADGASMAGDSPRLVDIARRAATIPPPDDRAQFVVHLLVGIADVLQGEIERGGARLAMADELAAAFDDPRYLLWAAVTELYSGRGDAKERVQRAVARARSLGALGVLPFALEMSALGAVRAGHVTEAVAQASEGLRLARDTGQQTAAGNLLAALAMANAMQGREQECRRYVEESLTEATSRGLGLVTAIANYATAVLDLSLGRPADALERLRSIATAEPGEGHPLVTWLSAHDLVEAAVRAGRRDVAEQAVADFATWSRDAGPSRRAMLAYCRGLVGDSGGHFEEALRLLTIPMPFWRARIELGYGEHLRRARRRSAARSHLRAALETFERLHLTPWAERARAELRASGETARKRDLSAVNQLTPQELQIAGFVSQGASNPEIAAQLFLSRRTIEYHLGKVFQKLGVTSRTELAVLQLH